MTLEILLGFARPHWRALALCGLLMLMESAATLALPWLAGHFAVGMITAAEVHLSAIITALLVLLAAQALLKFANAYLLGRTAERVLADLRVRVYDHLQALPLGFYHERRQGDVLALITYEVAQLSGFITGTLLSAIPLLLTVAGAVALMVWIDPLLAGVVTVLVPVFYLLLKVLGRRLRRLAAELQKAQAGAVAIAADNLGMLPAIKTFTREALESRRYDGQIRRVMRLGITQQRIYAVLMPAIQFTAATAVVLLLWLAGERVSAGAMSPAELVTFLLYAALLTRPVAALAGFYGHTQSARGTLARLQSVLDERPEPIATGGRDLGAVRGDIAFEGVSFAYPGREGTLHDIDLKIRARETIALTGENGAGKSTLVHLLMRLHAPDAGRILIDGSDIAEANLTSLRRQIAVVPQHVLLCNGTVRENIEYGKPGAAPSEVEKAAMLAQAHAFILELPQGYDTNIGDDGVRLSGGQRQRIALARALLKEPPILILDEATAMFDPEGERSLLEDAAEAFAARTVILITHRPASLALADRIVRLERGRIAPVPSALAARPAPAAAAARAG